MAPPTYGDLGKQARDIFSKNYRKWRRRRHHQSLVVDSADLDPNLDLPLYPLFSPEFSFTLRLNPTLSPTTRARLTATVGDSAASDVGLVKLDVKTKTASNVEFAVNGTSINDTGRVNASFETKYLFKDLGCTLKEKWTTDNTILTEVSFQDQLVKGSKVVVSANIAPQSGKKTGAVKTSLKGECFNSNVDFDFDSLNNGTVINGSLVLG